METAFICISVFVTSILSGVFGMAGGMVLMGLLVWRLPVGEAMMLHATAQFFSNASRAVIHRSHLHTATLRWYLLGLALVFGFFCVVRFVPEKPLVFFLLGIGPYLQLALDKVFKLDFTKSVHAFLCGMAVTAFHLTAGVSGPILNMFFQDIALDRYQSVATKALTQAIGHVVKFAYFGVAASVVTGLPLWIYLAVIPFAILGNHCATYVLDRMTDKQFYKATQAVMLVTGAVYLWKALHG